MDKKSNRYLPLVEMAVAGDMDGVHLALMHDLLIPCYAMGTTSQEVGHYNINLRLHILKNIALMRQGIVGKWPYCPAPWGCDAK